MERNNPLFSSDVVIKKEGEDEQDQQEGATLTASASAAGGESGPGDPHDQPAEA